MFCLCLPAPPGPSSSSSLVLLRVPSGLHSPPSMLAGRSTEASLGSQADEILELGCQAPGLSPGGTEVAPAQPGACWVISGSFLTFLPPGRLWELQGPLWGWDPRGFSSHTLPEAGVWRVHWTPAEVFPTFLWAYPLRKTHLRGTVSPGSCGNVLCWPLPLRSFSSAFCVGAALSGSLHSLEFGPSPCQCPL